MAHLDSLKKATSLHDVAHILGFKPRTLAYILHGKASHLKYKQFEIYKRSGGVRTISAPYPALMKLQKRLSDLLQNCIAEINQERKVHTTLSHGFRRKYSIITNAQNHKKSKFVFNLDLSDFFGTINFGRVRGFFIQNRNFRLTPDVATVLAQIICHENSLPQGSPCSPVVSNLIGHILDIRLAKLAYTTGCSYSRYADDLTFSTNKPIFPVQIGEKIKGELNQWQVSEKLTEIIGRTGFAINENKTRMQYSCSRQEVTGLVVNKKVNIKSGYWRTVRAMVHRLFCTGSFEVTHFGQNEDGEVVETTEAGSIEQLNGMLSFIDSVDFFNKKTF